jgi:hypothetical protein
MSYFAQAYGYNDEDYPEELYRPEGFDALSPTYTGAPRCRHERFTEIVVNGYALAQCLDCGIGEVAAPEREAYPEDSIEAPDREC